jgi:hypothetical protein
VIYYVRGIAVSSSIFFALYSISSVAVCCLWRRVWQFGQRYSSARCADLLFVWRLVPVAVAGAITLALAIPSFLLLEPRAIDERMSGLSVVLGLSGIGVVLGGIWRAVAALMKASRVVSRWSSGECVMESIPIRDGRDLVPVLRISGLAPPLTVSGILRPSMWLSRAAEFALTEPELETALRHEFAHVRRRDNLRRLILHLVAFPGMAQLETAWREATEMAADDAAVSSASEALDLASAMLKLTELISPHPSTELTAALVRSPADCLNARVRRLIAWPEQSPTQKSRLGYAMGVAAAVAATLALTYGQLLVQLHAATECLVR